MIKKFFTRGQALISAPQSTVLSAAFVIMLMNITSSALGIVRHRVLLSYFSKDTYGLYLASFRLPDMVFELFALGVFSAAFIPVFTKLFKNDTKAAWDVAARVMNSVFLIFAAFALIFAIFAPQFYRLVVPTLSGGDFEQVILLSRILFLAQGFFVISYVLSGMLESLQRFLIPAISPLFYNLGIIFGTLLFANQFGLMAPAIGAVIGAAVHMLIQLPLLIHLGFRFKSALKPNDGVKKIGKLAAPRFLELGILQVLKTAELFFASTISVASYTYLYLANSLQVVPIGLFAVSLSKASLPMLARQEDDPSAYRKTFLSTLYQMMFIVIPIAAFLIVLRTPIVRLIYGTDIFDWEATIQTGMVLTAFAFGIPLQAGLTLLSRAFYAIHDTKTPVALAIFDAVLTIILDIIFVIVLRMPVWSIALANTIAGVLSFSILYLKLSQKMDNGSYFSFKPITKIIIGASSAAAVMFFLLKLFDRSVWIKRLSFLGNVDAESSLVFRHFVVDTRYTINLLILTIAVTLIGGFIYLGILYLLKSDELTTFINTIKKGKMRLVPSRDGESITQPQTEST